MQTLPTILAAALALASAQPAMAKGGNEDGDHQGRQGRDRDDGHGPRSKLKHGKNHYKYEYRDARCEYQYEYNYKTGREKIKQEGDCRGVVVMARPVAHGQPLPRAIPPEPQARRIECNRDVLGAVIGGAIGAGVGYKVGNPDNRVITTAGGAVIGAVIGGAIGRSMDEADQACASQALEYAHLKQPVVWQNKTQNASYTLTPTEVMSSAGGECRRFQMRAVSGGQTQTSAGTACRQPNGTWQIRS